ncbi:hypothetical protein Ciccas_006623 [Cichlidogyrus casuarinus]|uniref:Ig-like domain-containing protein n=1 Tax=Cichlidogyrus casuarinus TaxID=1844966 RepID=A0ABD2Q7N5_9PLAT
MSRHLLHLCLDCILADFVTILASREFYFLPTDFPLHKLTLEVSFCAFPWLLVLFLLCLVNGEESNLRIFVESLWDQSPGNSTSVQAGESATFICRIWAHEKPDCLDVNCVDSRSSKQIRKWSVFLFCPYSSSYCAQDCAFINNHWSMSCSENFRIVQAAEDPLKTDLRSWPAVEWHVMEVVYKVDLATLSAMGKWRCSYLDFRSQTLDLTVKDRPIVYNIYSSSKEAVEIGQTVNITCEAAHSPLANLFHFDWQLNGMAIPFGSRIIRANDTLSILSIDSVQAIHSGVYTCQVSKEFSTKFWPTSQDGNSGNSNDPSIRSIKVNVFRKLPSLLYDSSKDAPRELQLEWDAQVPLKRDKLSLKSINITDIHQSYTLEISDLKSEFYCTSDPSKQVPQQVESERRTISFFGKPVITVSPDGPISENRTRVVYCTSKSGGLPSARLSWKYYSQVLVNGKYEKVEKPLPIGYSVNTEEIEDANLGTFITRSEIKIIGYRWLNSGTIKCISTWKPAGQKESMMLEAEYHPNEIYFPPTLALPGIQTVSAAQGSVAVIDLHVWAYPEIREDTSRLVKWYLVTLKETSEDANTSYEVTSKQPIILDHCENCNLASRIKRHFVSSEIYRANLTECKHSTNKLATVFRLLINRVSANDYGYYMCEIDHLAGRKRFFAKVTQIQTSPVEISQVKFTKNASNVMIKLQQDLSIYQSNYKPHFEWISVRVCSLDEDPFAVENRKLNKFIKGWVSFNENSLEAGLLTSVKSKCVDRIFDGNVDRREVILSVDEHEKSAKEKRDDANNSLDLRSPLLCYQLRFYQGTGDLIYQTNWYFDRKGEFSPQVLFMLASFQTKIS